MPIIYSGSCKMAHVLVTGGAGYIGSHVVTSLVNRGFEVTVLDNLSTGLKNRIENLKINFIFGDLKDSNLMDSALQDIDLVVHLAGSKSVEESMKKPLKYWENVSDTVNLLLSCEKNSIKKIIFSSTAAVYDSISANTIDEHHSIKPNSVYGKTKIYCELVIEDWALSFQNSYFIFRYFNVGGSSHIHLRDNSTENLIPKIISRIGKNLPCEIYGNDYDTRDGTCIRDYIHVSDLAEAHIKAVDILLERDVKEVINLGSGIGYSVQQVLDTVQESLALKIERQIAPRRDGDVASLVASINKANELLSWVPQKDLRDIVNSSLEGFQMDKRKS
jgi:UDP-glucose 4-epimerase